MDTPLEVPNVPTGGKTPPKYIRTFSGDMETVQQGGTPDLAPLPEATPLERIVAPSPISEEPAPEAKEPEPVPAPAPAYVPAPPERAPIETYGSDFVNRVKETKASTATLIAAEQDQSSAMVEEAAPAEKKSNVALAIGGVALFVLGTAGAAYAYLKFAPPAPVVIEAPLPTPIFVDERQDINGTPTELLSLIAASAQKPITTGSVRLLHASTTVFKALPFSTPGILKRNVNDEGSMAGVVSVGGVQSPFFILSVASYTDTFAGMLTWEILMPRDLASLYPSSASVAVGTTTATSTPKRVAGFRDESSANHDVRVYRDGSGKSVFLYGYWDQKTLIIARDPAAFAEIVGRLATSRSR
ncbi:MAG TPA: hypothetical protein VFP46_00250 [Candidatus Paceibacterota bacterium]|nr:hypothetical protein [Candidatus Paceibacterota bacterium]